MKAGAENTGVAGIVREDLSWDDDNGNGKDTDPQSQTPPILDLNSESTQEKLRDLILYGGPPADKRGHYETLSFKVPPYQMDIMESVRGMAPRNHWRTRSEYLRCAFTVGNFIIMKYLKEAENCNAMDSLFSLYDMINAIAKKQNEEQLRNEYTRALASITDNEETVRGMVTILSNKMSGK